jgi:hypothetical protein
MKMEEQAHVETVIGVATALIIGALMLCTIILIKELENAFPPCDPVTPAATELNLVDGIKTNPIIEEFEGYKDPHVVIEQYADISSYTEGTFHVGTQVWIRDKKGRSISLELWEQEEGTKGQVESIHLQQMKLAIECKQKIETVINRNIE